MTLVARVQSRILLVVVFIVLAVAVVTIDQRRREAERRVADLLRQIENNPPAK